MCAALLRLHCRQLLRGRAGVLYSGLLLACSGMLVEC